MKDDLSPVAVTSGLETRFIGQRVIYHPKLKSTMEVARKEALAGVEEGVVVIAGEQTDGRGRMERRWISPRGCVALSVILHPSLTQLPLLTMVASLAVVKAIAAVTGIKARIKWPNDILIGGKKVCGILVESGVRGRNIKYAVIGIGINVNVKADSIGEVALPATSLSDELGREVSRLELVRKLLVEMERLYLSAQSGSDVYQEWRDRLETLGKKVRARSGDTVYEGTAESVDEDGSLLIRCQDGRLARFAAGDITLQS
jgi:biotin-[acetyl-CoA-carboxylase] ligase BirA-like protein